MAAIRKFLVALAAAIAVAISVTADGDVSINDVFAMAGSFVGSLGVGLVPNVPKPTEGS